MKGRKEHEEKIMKHIDCILQDVPYYVRDYYNAMNRKTATTKLEYIRHLLNFLDFLKKETPLDINDVNCFNVVKPSRISRYLTSMSGVSDGFKATRLYGVKNFFKYLAADDIIEKNPCNQDKIEAPKVNSDNKITYLSREEIQIVKDNIFKGVGSCRAKSRQVGWESRDYAIIMLALSLGLRVSSICEINIEDIDFDTNELVVVEKGNKTRRLVLSPQVKIVLHEWVADRANKLMSHDDSDGALFVSNRLARITPNGVAKLVKKYTYNIDKHITPHKLRSTCATNVYNATGDIYLTAHVLGHSNSANTRRYAQISEERKQKAAMVMDDILF